jgi:nucleotide-binding universal stress UspA family protein
MTLFVPDRGRNCISSETGHLGLRRVLVPVARDTNSRPAIEFASRAAQLVRAEEDVPVVISLFHVGRTGPSLDPEYAADTPDRKFEVNCKEGDVVDEIIAAAEKLQAELIVMTTQGSNSLIDAIKGSKTQQVLRRSPCPILAVPAVP